jgi:hypothetical protein
VATVTRHPEGDTAVAPHAGDFLLTGVKAQGIVSWAIKTGSWLRRYEKPYRRFSHTALVISDEGEIAEAVARGVIRSPLTKYEQDDYVLVRTEVDPHDCSQVLEFTESVLGAREPGNKAETRYGFWTFAGLALYCVTGAQLCVQMAGTAICSGFVSDALTRAGFIWARPPFSMMPADLARHFEVTEEPAQPRSSVATRR